MTCIYATVFANVLNDALDHAYIKGIANSVITVNRHGDNNAHIHAKITGTKSGIVALKRIASLLDRRIDN